MKRLAVIGLIALAALAAPVAALAQASCSPITQGPATWTGIVNTYYPGTSATVGPPSASIGVGAIDGRGASTPIAAGDLLLIVQVQDASISSSNSTAYGGSGSGQGYTSLNSAGKFEYAVAAGPVAGGSVPLATALVNTYHTGSANGSDGQKRYQVIRVAQASSATLSGTLTAPPWNGSTGGIVAIDSAGNINFNGQVIDVDGRGFRGGGGQDSTSDGTGAPVNAITDYVSNVGTGTLGTAGVGTVPNGAKGEGVAGTPIIVFTPTTPNSSAAGSITNTGGTDGTSGGYPGGSFGRGAPGNAGGGGTDGDSPANDQNTGGAGGGNYGIGGKGGFGWTPGTPPGWDGGGMGGMSVSGGVSRLFFGGGGGAGSTNNATGTPAAGAASSGASGGGMVFVRAGTTSGGGTINARGTSANTSVGNDASGGGGAGGSALVFVNNSGGAVGTSINIQGGNGGCNTGGGTSTGACTVPTGGAPHGPGGGGSGGFAILSGAATVNAAGGANGVTATSTTSTQDYGSTSSSGGFQIVSLTANQIPGSGGQGTCFPQLTVTKATSTPFVAAGAPATYTITVANAANKSTATGVSLSDVLPANPNMTYASNTAPVLAGGATRTATVDPAAGATSPSWGTFSIPGGGSVALTFVANTVLATPSATYQNPATVTYLDPTRTAAQTVTPGGTYLAGGTVGGSNYVATSSTAEDVTVVVGPAVTKAFNPQAVAVGGTSTLTVTISNPGSTALTAAGLIDNYPAGMVNAAAPGGATTCGGSVTAAPGGTSFTLAGGTLPSSSSCTVTVNVKITAAGAYTNTIPVGALTDAQNVSNIAAGAGTLYTDVTVAKSFAPNAVAPNSNSTVSLVLTNPNTTAVTLANPGLTDSFPANLVAAGGAVTVTGAGCTGYLPATLAANATSLALTAGTIPASSSCTVSFAVKSATTGIYANTTSGVTTVETGVTGPASNTANLGVGVINIAKAFAPANIVANGTSVLTFTLSNPTGVAQTAGAFTDTLANMQVSVNQNTGGTCAPVTALTAGQTALSFSGLNVPAAGCTLTLVVTSSTVGAQNNTSGGVITALLPRGPSSNTATLNVLGKPAIAKAFAPVTILPGATSTLTFTITNPGPVGLTGMSFTDTYGAGLVNASPLAVGGSCTGVTTTATAGGNTFNVTAGAIPASASCTITVAVTAAAVGSYTNTASGVATTETGAAGTGSNTATLSVANPPTIAKAFGTTTISQGGTSVVTFTIANGNTVPLNNLNFTDALTNMSVASPATIGGTCVGTTNSPSLAAGATALNLTVPSLGAGASCTVTVTLTSGVSGIWSNTASGVTSTQTPTAGAVSNTASLTVLSPPSLAKAFVPGAIQTGATSVMTFTLTNPNAANALTNATFSDTLVNMSVSGTQAPGGTCTGTTPASITGGATALTLAVPSLAAGASCTITVVVTSNVMSVAAGHPNTTGTVSATETAVNPGAAATGNLVVWAPPTVTKAFSPNSIATNGTSTVTFTITNPNPGGLTNIRFTDDLPTNLSNTAAQTFIGAGRGTCTGTIPTSKVAGLVDPITFSSTNLAANSSCTIMMDMTSGTAGSYTNTVTSILSDQTPTATTGGSDVLTVGRVSIAKAFSAATVQTNGTATLTFTITNGSGGNRTGLAFTDNFPAGMAAVGGAVTTGGTCTSLAPTTVAANATSYNLTALNLNNNITCTISFPVRITTAGVKSNTVTGTAPAQFTGSTDTATITAFDAPAIAKAFAPATMMAGDTTTLTFTLTNPNGFAALSGAAFSDTLANMSAAGAQTVGGTCVGTTPAALANGATALAFTGITIPAGGSCTVTVAVTSTTVGVQPNTASGVTTTQTPTAGANSGAVNLTVAGINLGKVFSPTARPVGVASTLTFTLTSTQSVAWTGLAFTDTLQAGLVVASPSNATTTCGAGTITATPGTNLITLAGGAMAAGGGPCTVSVDVVSAATATYTNNGTNLSATSPGLAFTGAAATVQYFGAATLTKAFGASSIAAGATATLTFTLANPAGAQAVSGLGFTDTFPAGLTVAAAPGASNTCGATWAPAAGASSATLSGGSLGAGPATCTATVSVTAATLGNYVNNSSNLGALAGGLTAAGVNASLAVVGTALTKQFNPLVVGPSAISTLTFTIANGSGNPAQSGLAFTDTLPANLVVATPPGTTSTCGGAVTAAAGAGSIALAGGSLAAAQASCTVAVNVTSVQAGSYANTASNISGTAATMDASGVNATLTVLSSPAATKTFGATFIPPGGTTSLTLAFTNGNNSAVTGLAFIDTFPVVPGAMTLANTTATNTCGGSLTDGTGAALNAGDTAIKLTGGTIPANGSCAVTVNVTASTAGAYTNTIVANGITTTNAGAIASATSGTVTVPSAPTIAKSFAGPIGPGRTVTLTFTLTNPNAVTAVSGVAFSDTLPTAPAAMVVAATPNATTSGCGAPTFAPTGGAASVIFSAGTIAASGTCMVTVDVTVPAVGTYNNTTGTITATGPVALTGTTASGSLTVVQPTLAKVFAPAAVDVNQTSTLTFTLTNGAGNPAQSGINFTDTLPVGVVAVSPLNITSSCPSGAGAVSALAGSGTITVTGATMSSGQASCTINVDVRSAAAGTFNNTNAANLSAVAHIDASGASATLTVRAQPILAKAFAGATVGIGQATTLTLTVDNTGANAVARAGLSFTDTLPAGITIANPTAPTASAACGAPTFTAANATQPFAASAISVAAAQTCTITLTVRGTALGAAVNGALQITAIGGMANGVTAQTLTVVQPTAAKTFGVASINDNAATSLVFTLANGAGNPAEAGIALGDTLPASLRFNSATPAVAYSAGCSGPATATYTAATRVLSGLTGIAMTAGTASCTVTLAGVTNAAMQTNASCAGNPAAFTNLAANVTATNATPGGADQCLVVSAIAPNAAKTFGAASINDGAATTLVFTLANQGSNPAQSGIALGDTLPTGLAINSATPAVAYSAGCSGPATATYTAATRALSGLGGIAMTAGTASCTVTVSGVTNQATQTNASCAGNPAAFTNAPASVTTTNAANTSSAQCLVVNRANPAAAKTFGVGTIADGAATTLVFTLTNSGTNPAQPAITLGDTLPTGLAINSATPAVAYSAGCSGPATATYTGATRVLSGLTGIAMTAGTASCTVTVSGVTNQATQTNASCAGNPVAFTNLAANVTATNATPGGADQCLAVTRANASAAKTFGAASINDAGTTTLVFTLANSGTNPAQSAITLGDTLPTGLALNSTTPAVAYSAGCSGPATATYTAATRVLSGLSGIAMTAGTASCTVTVAGVTNQAGQVNASCAGNPAAFTNLAASVATTGINSGSSDQCLVVNRLSPTVAKTFGAGTFADGAATTLVFTLANQGTNPAQSAITLGDTLPTGLRLNAATPAVAYSAGCSGPATATYTAATRVLSGLAGIAMANGTASCTVTVAGLTNAATQVNASCAGNPVAFTNLAANVTATNATPGGADQCVVVTRANPTVAKTFGAASINDTAATSLVFTLTNSGTNPAQSAITLGDTLPTALALNSATPAVAYSAGCSGPATATYTSATHVLSGLTGLAMAAGTASCTVTVAGVTNQAGQVNASCAGNPAAFTNLAANVTATNATLSGSDQCLVVNHLNPNVAKTFGAASINDGGATTLVFTLANQGSNPAQSAISLGDTLPAGLALNSATPAVAYSAGCSGPATATYTAATRVLSGLAGIAMANGTASCTVTVAGLTNTAGQVNATCPGTPAFTNLAASVTAAGAANTSTDQCLLVNRINPTAAKTFGAGSIADGGTTTLVFTLANQGTNPAQSGIALGDTLPGGLAINSAAPAVAYSAGCAGPATATYTAATRVLSGLTGVTMANGTASCTVTVAGVTNQASQVNASCAGNPAAFTNLVGNVTTTAATNASANQCLVVTSTPPTVAKTFGAGSINDSAATTLVFTLANSGTAPAQAAITIGDTLPASLRLNSATPAVAYSAGCSGPATAAYTAGTRVLSGLSGIAMAAGTASCTVTVAGLTNAAGQVNASCAGNPAAFTNLAANVTAANATPGGADQCLVVNLQSPNVAKTFGAVTIADGAATTLVFTITNQGSNPAQSGIGIGDTLPTGLALGSATPAIAYSVGCSGPATATYTAATRVLSGLTGIAMTNGTASCTVTVAGLTNAASQVNASCPAAAFTNAAASVTTVGSNNTSTAQCLVVTRTNASLGKAFAPATIDAGGTSTLVFTITNSGTNPAQSGIGFTDTLPAGVAVAGAPNVQSNCPAGGAEVNNPAFVGTTAGSITVTGAALSAGVASCDVRVTVTAPAAGVFNNTNAANISAPANVTTTGVAATLTVQALPTLAKAFGAANVGIGQTTTLAFTLDNTAGPVNRSGLSFSDALPAGLEVANPPVATTSASCQSPALTGTANASTTAGASSVGVNTGQTCVITFTVRGTTLGGKTNNAASMTVGGLANAVTPQTVTVVQPSLDKVFGPASIAAGGTSTLTFTLANGAGSPAQSGIGFTDTLPGNVRVAATPNVQTNCPAGAGFAAPGFTVSAAAAGTSIAVAGAAMNGAVASCQVRVDVTSAIGGAYTNDSTNISAPVNVTNAVAGTTLTVTGAAPSVAKSFAPNTIAAGATSTLTITLANPNASVASLSAALTDTLPTGLTVASPANAATTCSGAGAVAASSGGATVTLPGTRTIPAAVGLTPGSCTVTVDVTATLGGAYSNVITANALQTSNGNNASPASALLTVNAVAPALNVSFAPSSIAANGTSTLTITLTNPNITAAALSAALADTFPAGLVIAATPNASTTCGGSGAVAAAAGSGSVTLPATRSIPAGSGSTAGSCTISVDVTSAVGGSYGDTLAANALQTADGNNANPASATLTVTAVAPSVAKQFAPATVNANTPSTLTITLTNGNASAANLTAAFTDTFPSPVVVAATPNAASTCAGAGAVVAAAGSNTVTLPTTRSIPAAAGATPGSCTITVDVVSPVGGTFTNTIPANALQTSNGNASAASASLTVNAVAPTIAKQFAPAAIAADGTSTVTLTISSANATALTGASFGDTLAGMAVSGAQSAGGTCAGAAGNSLTNGQTAVAISGLTIPAASGATPGSCTVTFVVTSDVPGPHNNQASGVASAQAPTGSASNVATLTVSATAPTIAKAFGPASIAYGATSTITFTLSNTNGVPLTGAAFSDTLANISVSGAQAAGGTCAGAAGNNYANGQTGLLNFAGLTIPANASCTVTIGATSAMAGGWPNQASGVSSNEAPTGAASNTATLTVTAAALTVSKTFTPATINSGDFTTLAITITNPNAAAVTALGLTDTFPATPGAGLVRAATPNASTTCTSGTVTSTAGSVTLSGATLGAGASCTFQIDVTAATAGTYTNTIPAGAIASSAGSNTVAATKSLTVNPLANLAVSKLGPATTATGATINYTITVSNAGPDAANGATFADSVPGAITGVSAVCTGAAGGAACGAMSVSGNSVTSTIPTLPAGGSVSITVSGTASGVGSVTNTATVTSPAGVPDPVPANNTSSVTTNVLAPDLTIAKTHSGSFTVGSNGAYTITVSNAPGSLPTSGTITVTDTLPAGLGFVSATGTGWACGFAAGTVTCTTASSLAAGTAANPITLTVSVASTAVPSVTNFATVAGGGEPAGTTGNNTASDNTIVVAGGVNVFQPDGTQTGMPGTVVSYPHTFNAGLAGTVAFSTSAIATPAVPGWTQTIYRDTDCNGVINGAEGSAPLTGSIAVNAGDTICIVVRDSIPGTAPYNAQNAISVNATFNGSQVSTRHDTTTVGAAAGAGLVLAKSVRNVTLGSGAGTANTARPNDVLEYSITYTNTSAGTVSAIVVTDATPAFTTFLSAACGAPLPGNITSCTVTAQPAVNGAGSVVWTLAGSLLSNGSGTVLYQVRVAP